MGSTGTGWAQLRQQARQLESQTETLFHTYSQYASASTVPAKPSEDEQKTETQLTEILEKALSELSLRQRESIIASLTRLLDSDAQPSALKSSHLARHRETLSTHRADYARLQSTLSHARSRTNLLSSVRQDISAYRAANSQNLEGEEAEYMLNERARIDNSNSMADSVLSQAYAVNESFGMQREQLERVRRRVMGVVGMVPGVNGLIGRIGNKKRRDGIILGSFIAFCVLTLLYFL